MQCYGWESEQRTLKNAKANSHSNYKVGHIECMC